ncbi:MAG: tetratricopeptide repeat protein [Bacteroidales bacterium]|nr:tetratricopeptide repeat protein [Bacteroidales bacterium]MCF8343762.1 tetratricopeptide repeat protein [Bacteroidales bacterium]MCF8351627.1 tetratricopeptide repeat protein [Bacteroidales bacterium]MCF8375245.1 tetratricopeptide repeat protein [Bacteroidales bacterium]MCF8400269.1 tetratricopeptide repeat protein [Bacteroidales bacterium]
MSNRIKYLLLVLFLWQSSYAQTEQTSKRDSLKQQITETTGEEKVELWLMLAKSYLSTSPQKVIEYGEKAYNYSDKIGYQEGEAKALNRIGSGYYLKGNYDSAMRLYDQSLDAYIQLDKKRGMADAYSNIALIYDGLGNYNKALEFNLKSLEIEEGLGNKWGIAVSLNNIGNVYYYISNFDKALENYQNALNIYLELDDANGVAQSYNNIGSVYQVTKDYGNAETYFHSALVFHKKLNNPIEMASCYNNLGNVYVELNDFREALYNYEKSLEISESIDDKWSMANTYMNIGGIYLKQKQYKKAENFFEKAADLAEKINAKGIIANTNQALSELYAEQNRHREAYDHILKYNRLHDSLFNKETRENIKNLEMGYELQKQEREIELLQQQDEIRQLKLEKSRKNTYIFLAIILVIIVLIIFIYNRYRNKKNTNKLLEQKNEEISRKNDELNDFNKKLESRVIERTKSLEEELRERKKIDIELKKALKNAEDANYLKNAFLANMSHEIRTPLNGIIGFSSLLETELSLMENKELYEYANGIQKSGERLLHLLNNIIDISRIEANDMDITIDSCHVNEIIKNVAELYSFKANDKGIKFNTKLNDLPQAVADEVKLTKIISDIIDNAIKYTEKGFINVVTEFDEKSKYIRIIVKDTGIGIDQAYLDHIFEAFRQESLGYSRTYQGAGLGLPLAKRLTELMNGKIEVDSKKGVGTTVMISIPTDKVEKTDFSKDTKNGEKPDTAEPGNLNIFIVEDDRMNRLVIKKMLSKMGKVVAAVDGDETIQIINENYKKGLIFDIMLFDINLPAPWDGIKLMNKIKNDFKEYRKIPFIAQTAYAMAGDKERLLESGFDNYLAKPINKNEMINMINKQLKINNA